MVSQWCLDGILVVSRCCLGGLSVASCRHRAGMCSFCGVLVCVVKRLSSIHFFPSTFCTGSAGVPCHVGTAMNLQKALVSRWFLGGLLLVSRRSWWCLLVAFWWSLGGVSVVSRSR